MSNDLLKTAALHLKKAVPLMLKHSIPTTPTNYALWYAYVSETNPKLNLALDENIKLNQQYSPVSSELLYREHIADPVELDVRTMRQNLDAMVCELSQSIKDTHHDTRTFQSQIQKNVRKLTEFENQDFSLEQLVTVVRSMVKESSRIQSSSKSFTEQLNKAQSEINILKQKLAKTEKDVLYDALTETLNRRAFNDDINAVIAQSPQGCCLIMADIDNFKLFNDTYGHQLGDLVLRVVAKRLQESCREGVKLYRFGGEEFAIIVPNSQLRIARQLAEAMRRSIEKLRVKDRRSDTRIDNVNASFGVVQWQENQTTSQLIEAADQLLYQAKRLGRNRVMPI
ncbi:MULTISPECIES: GGDEF domain-containing protein [unclassified Shewanella]|uniref:GGDEF domain-containing protein n=1 Tax=unclassified Shewanella TaxID=196818 RepID=UPI000C8658B9|nr:MULTISPECIES: GGDEF domain-containing protein [unclassified Shewanella]MDO6618160.1 GGDEF domain-containing protein [Shewanella sp. 6_MG-2023]MDO6638432.1 GGDEF domain-containing protein [Shewanella sp. 5_MG-2023]MDO6774255.1 GGDEF domain-containing protein [Shewanella sp. 3_MG-2023]PMG41410.1 diguanylate cyclase [Shewanella sp. 10N.286.52.B9]PMH85871.1 diguanylate cyclase [Shewanella sp. 10N.286.48.B5]